MTIIAIILVLAADWPAPVILGGLLLDLMAGAASSGDSCNGAP